MAVGIYEKGGASVVIENLARVFRSYGHYVGLGSLFYKDFPNFDNYDAQVSFRKIARAKRELDSFDLIHLHQPSMGFIAYVSRAPVVYHYHGAPTNSINLFRLTDLGFNSAFSRKYSSVIAISETAKREFEGRYKAKNVNVVYNGVDTRRFNPSSPPRFRMGQPQLLFVGNLTKHKNVGFMIRSVRSLVKIYPSLHLSIVGRGPEMANLTRSVASQSLSDRVTFWGSVADEELPEHYASCDAYVSASEWELFDLPLLEAMATSKPVVASSIPVHVELAKKSNGIVIYRGDDLSSLCDGINSAIENSSRLGGNGLMFAQSHRWNDVAERVTEVYRQAIAGELPLVQTGE